MFQMTQRQLTLLIVFPIFIVICFILGLLILRKDYKYWGNRFFAIAFWLHALGLFFNLLYLFSINSLLIAIFNFISIFWINMGSISILLGILVIYKGENEIFQNRVMYILIVIMIIMFLPHAFFPDGIRVENNIPIWSLTFGIYQLCAYQLVVFVTMYFSIKLFMELSPEMRRKFKRLIVGGIFINITFIAVGINNMQIIPGFEPIFAIVCLLVFVGIILVYSGLVHR